jgi:hypothetical protein
VVGLGRSGTTLLRLMLDAHPELAIPAETHFIPQVVRWFRRDRLSAVELAERLAALRRWGDFGIGEEEMRARLEPLEPLGPRRSIRAFYELYAEHQGKPRWGDKTPGYSSRMHLIQNALPEARFIHLIRDGRDAALSRAEASGKTVRPERAAKRWVERIGEAREEAKRIGHYIELRYEDLIVDPEAVLRRICEYIDLRFAPEMLDYHRNAAKRLEEMARDLPAQDGKGHRSGELRVGSHAMTQRPPDPTRVARWRTDMRAEEVDAFEEIAGELLIDLGYEVRTAAGR